MKLLLFFKSWSFERYFRLGLAILVGIYAINTKEYSVLIVTAWLGVLALFNISCCGTRGCGTTLNEPTDSTNNDIVVKYEEIENGNKKL